MNLKVEKFGTATWYFCPSCHKRIVVENAGHMLGGVKCNQCPECGQLLYWNEEAIRKKSRWRKFRQAICWFVNGRYQEHCRFEVNTAHPAEIICCDCKHNLWKKRIMK